MATVALTDFTAIARRGFPVNASAGTLSTDMAQQESDESLMLRYQRGETQAFDLLFERHKDAIFRFLKRQCGQAAEEIFQDVWLRLIEARHQFQPNATSRFINYLYRIAHNKLMDYFRRTNVKNRLIDDNVIEIDELNDASNQVLASPEVQIDTQHKLEKLLMLIDSLPNEQREAFLLREESGLSIQAIAEVTGVNRETAKSRLRYAFERIRHGMRGLK